MIGDDEIGGFVVPRCAETCGVIHHPDRAGDRRLLFEEEGELEFGLGALRVEAVAEGVDQLMDIVHVELRSEFIEHLDEAAHVRPFVVVRKIDGERDVRDGVLEEARLVSDLHGVAKILYAYPVDWDLAEIGFALGILEVGERRWSHAKR